MSNVRIVGVGQRLSGDDGVGRRVAELLAAEGIAVEEVSDGAGLLNLLLEENHRFVIVDALRAIDEPGRIHVLERQSLAASSRSVSSHRLSVPEAIALANAMGTTNEFTIVGVEIDPLHTASEGLSPAVEAGARQAAKLIQNMI